MGERITIQNFTTDVESLALQRMHLQQVILKWWTANVMPRLKPIFYVVPSIIVWELWKKRNGDKNKDKVTISKIIYQVSITQVIWNFPNDGTWKCNIDGATRGNPGRSSFAFCVRNSNRDLIHAHAKEMGDETITNTDSEALALLEAARYCLSQHFYSFILEIDSLLMNNILDRQWKPPWNIAFVVEETLDIIDNADVQVLHILSEGN
ncbi:uncharacterized protein LOC132611207 [Lycium barbarum]|uniref:uncharacterized protein LOC132611207 n=1 Tax=Lycium barbarum TaxID=112863 RepID=UPI00293F4E26|nr:uncharacterized protein LOC132611207 [Lycium barbarum]